MLEPWNIGHHSHHCGSLIGRVVLQRMPSGCFVDSTWITSAPRMAHAWPMSGPAQNAVRSSTRIPASGNGTSPTGGTGASGTTGSGTTGGSGAFTAAHGRAVDARSVGVGVAAQCGRDPERARLRTSAEPVRHRRLHEAVRVRR